MNLLIGKRQIVLAGLVVTLSLAVFVNWYYTNGETVIEREQPSGTQISADAAGEAIFVNADATDKAAAQVTDEAAAQVTDEAAAQVTDEAAVKEEVTADGAGAEVATSPEAASPEQYGGDEYFAMARLSRTKAFDRSVETLQQIITSNDGNSKAAVDAAQEISAITALLQLETNLESLISAKTGSQCVAVISDDSINIVVEDEKITDSMILNIHGILSDSNIDMENITISGC